MKYAIVLSLLCLAAMSPQAGATGGRASQGLPDLLDRYGRGDYKSVLAELNALLPTDDLYKNFERDGLRWIRSGGTEAAARRALIVAAFALEVAHTSGPADPWPAPPADSRSQLAHSERRAQRIGFILWACELVRENRTVPADVERWWYLASIAGLQELEFINTWPLLVGRPAYNDGRLLSLQRREGAGGHLAHALAKLANEPRLRLAAAEGAESLTICDGRFCFDESSPELIEEMRRRAGGIEVFEPRSPEESFQKANRDLAVRNLQTFADIPKVISQFAALQEDVHVGAEAAVHVGYLNIRLANWEAALAALSRVPTSTTEPHMVYLGDYFTGRALEGSGRSSAAIAAYRRALARVPNARSAAVRGAALLFLGDQPTDREQSYSLIDAAFKARPVPPDPWRLYSRGDARLWPEFMQRLREALR